MDTHRTTEKLTTPQIALLTGGSRRWTGAVTRSLMEQGLVQCDHKGRFSATRRPLARPGHVYRSEPAPCDVAPLTQAQQRILEVLHRSPGLKLDGIARRTSRLFRAEFAALRAKGLVFRVGKRWLFVAATGLSAILLLRALYFVVVFDPDKLLPTSLVLFLVGWVTTMVRPSWHWPSELRVALESERDQLRIGIASGDPAAANRAGWAYALSGYPEPGQPLDGAQARIALAAPETRANHGTSIPSAF